MLTQVEAIDRAWLRLLDSLLMMKSFLTSILALRWTWQGHPTAMCGWVERIGRICRHSVVDDLVFSLIFWLVVHPIRMAC